MLKEIPIKDLVPNDYNPPSRAERSKESLSNSLKKDGQITTITIRPVKGGTFEIVDGSRRFEAAKSARLSSMLCNVLELSLEEAMDYNYIANKETEPDSALDESWRFFQRLGLEEETLYTTMAKDMGQTLPTRKNREVQELALRLGINPATIEIRLPLMALPKILVNLIEKGEMSLSSAHEVARLRLLEDKDWAQQEMILAFNKCGDVPADLNVSVNSTLEDYRLSKELAEKDLKPYEDQVNEKLKKIQQSFKNAQDIISEFVHDLPEELVEDYRDSFSSFEDIEIPEIPPSEWTWPTDLIKHADRISSKLIGDNRYAKQTSTLQSKRNDLQVNRKYIENHGECRYCGTEIKLAKFDDLIKSVEDTMSEIKSKDDARSSAAAINTTLRKTLRDNWSDYSSAKRALDKAREKKEAALKRSDTNESNT